MSSRLNSQDQRRVAHYLDAPQHRLKRRPFRPWLLMSGLLAVVLSLGLLSRLLGSLAA
ncbi:hypothetical protein D3C78_538950 [compost metagenome]